MARKDKGTDVEDSDSKDVSNDSLFKDERIRFTVGLFLILLGVYIFLSFLSFLFTWKVDQSIEWVSIFSSTEQKIGNWGGKLGASLSNQFINHWFGITALAFPLIFMVLGLKLLKFIRGRVTKFIFKVLLGILVGSLTLGFLFKELGGYLGSGLGGAHGLFVSEWLSTVIGKVGAAFLVLIALIAYIIYVMPKSLYHFQSGTFFLFGSLRNFVVKGKQKESQSEKHGEEDFKQAIVEVAPVDISNERIKEKVDEFDDTDEIDDLDDELDLDVQDEYDGRETKTVTESTIEDNFTIERNEEKELAISDINEQELYDPTLELSSYQKPLIELLEDYKNTESPVTNEMLVENKNKIVETLSHYKIQIDKIKATIGPTVTLYEIVPAPGVRISKIKSLEDDIALSLSALGIRIIAPIPGKGTIGIEVPNQNPEVVSMHSIIKSQKFQECKYDLAIALGKTISNEIFMLDLTKLPHLLVAGATGQGKSVGLNAIITSLLYKKHPAEIKFVLVDPKMVELTLYNKLERHFLAKLPDSPEAIITDTQKVIYTLNSLSVEMEDRYKLLNLAKVRTIKEYNQKFVARRLNPNNGHRYLPYIVVIIDEFADLIMTAGREIEMPLGRLAQKARAIGIHLIIATQRPSTNIITGVIKANFPARIAFRVSSMVDSRTILDTPGANNLIGRGDMLVSAGSDLVRVQCAFVDIPEIERITDFIGNQPGYPHAYELPEYVPEGQDGPVDVDLRKRDELFEDAARLVVQTQSGSTSLIQRKFSIGYNRAGRIMDQLEAAGIVGPADGGKPRQVLIVDEVSLERILNTLSVD
ncbi:DNA translocase FtsK 4TM domain-containing protein [Tenuifilum sp.]|uniref:DNA translocase FtsK 4TM domain-containing protein n=3 Tax=Tenuifilum sp. TaxID=2760880 RepID=UPI002BB01CBD|nr:DNA translocase FtsK 4TM domain-containing protein [Tenuifilum sp.]HPP90594.1 DNA translocase FtsK 4TM domain-containing protein [Tenuifilum sp.]